MKCPRCQFDNPKDMQFCGRCGSKLANVCPECKFDNPPDFQFCGRCGAKLTGSESAISGTELPTLEDMHSRSQSWIPEELARKYSAAGQETTTENRPITALFADISGFTPLSNTQSSETMFQLVQDCFRELVGIVARYEGSISGFRGDGLLALFGAPILRENDAERAILAAMDMRSVMQDKQLQVSIGINTAMMTVGEIQTQLHREYTAYGTDVNLAKRLQEAASPGQILVGTGTHRLTRRMFDFDMLTNLSAKGFTRPVTAYAVLGVREHPEKLRGIEGLRARMIGREREFSDLKAAADELIAGRGSVVSIIGEAGLGKSRLVSELREYLRERGGEGASVSISILEGRCVSIGQPISYWPFIDILRTYFSIGEEDDTYAIVQKVTESINSLMPQEAEETLPLIRNLLSVIEFGKELDDRLRFATPEQIRHQTLIRLRDIFRTLAGKRPLLLILEDLHWSDDLSQDLISLLMDELTSTPLMLLCVYRPEKEHRVGQLGDQARRKCLDRYTELMLHPLSSHQSRLLVESLLEIENLPDSVKNTILTRSEGNPFFIEEVIRSLIEQDMVYREDDHWKARDDIASIHVPDTIQSVILARVDRLQEEAKYVLRCASVIGRLFRYRLLQHISRQERDLDRHIADFESKELIYEERTVPELEYAFKHAFTQEATYEGILEQRRGEFHHQVAQGIEQLYQERLEEYYEELAHHYSRSEDAEKAVEYLLKAGEKAKGSYANETAITNYRKALEILEQHGIERKDWKLEALRGLGEIYQGIGKPAEAEKAFEEAIELAKEMELPPHQLVRLYGWIADALWWQSRYDEVIRYGEMGLEVLGDDTECMEAALMNSYIAAGNYNKGDMEKWREYAYRSMAFIKKLPYSVELRVPYVIIIECLALTDGDLEAGWEWSKELERHGEKHHDLKAVSEAWYRQALILETRGDLKSALSSNQKSLEMLERIGDDKHASWCHEQIAKILLDSGDIEGAEAHAGVFMRMIEQVGNPRDIAGAHGLSGNIAMRRCRWEEAISHYQKGLKGWQTIGLPAPIAWTYRQLGRAYLKNGDPHRAFQFFEEAVDAAIASPQETSSIQILGQIENILREEQQQERFAPILTTFYEKMELKRPGFVVRALQSAVKSPNELVRVLRGAEMFYERIGHRDAFLQICQQLRDEYSEALKEYGLTHLHLESHQPSADYSRLDSADTFDGGSLKPVWEWVDPAGDCTCELISPSGLQVTVPPGHDLWIGKPLHAPRLLQAISGDFAVETRISDGEAGRKSGGLLVWKDEGSYIRFEMPSSSHWEGEVHLEFARSGEWFFAGRGRLTAETPAFRLERSGCRFTGYVSSDGDNWYRCGWADIPMEDPIQVGIHALCPESPATSTRFEYFRIYRPG